MAEEIRPDLKDISNTVNHLLQLACILSERSIEVAKLWNNSFTRRQIFDYRNKEIINAVEALYTTGVGTAQKLSELLRNFAFKRVSPLKSTLSL